jgi:hypothetical protein
MKKITLLILLCALPRLVEAQTYKVQAIRMVSATYEHPMADVKVETVTFTFRRNGSITVSDSTGLILYFTRSKAMELFDLTSAATDEIGSNILNHEIEQGFDAGEVLARDGYYIDVGTPSVSDLGKIMMFAGLQIDGKQVGLFYTVKKGDGKVCALIFADDNLIRLNINLEKWKAKYYY